MAIAIDPVCLMEVDTGDPPGGHSEYESTDYYFCSPGCKVAFDRDPDHVLSGRAWRRWTTGTPMTQARSLAAPPAVSWVTSSACSACGPRWIDDSEPDGQVLPA